MNRYFLIRYDQTGDAALREAKRGEHVAYRKGLGNALSLAGPILGDGEQPVGSVIILAAPDRGAAERIAGDDPFVQAGLLTIASIEQIRIAAMVPPTA